MGAWRSSCLCLGLWLKICQICRGDNRVASWSTSAGIRGGSSVPCYKAFALFCRFRDSLQSRCSIASALSVRRDWNLSLKTFDGSARGAHFHHVLISYSRKCSCKRKSRASGCWSCSHTCARGLLSPSQRCSSLFEDSALGPPRWLSWSRSWRVPRSFLRTITKSLNKSVYCTKYRPRWRLWTLPSLWRFTVRAPTRQSALLALIPCHNQDGHLYVLNSSFRSK